MSVQAMRRHEFTWAFPQWQPPPGAGLVAVIPRAEATRGWVKNLLAVEGDRQVVWTALGGEPEARSLDIVEQFEVSEAALVAEGADPRQVFVALQVASRLSRQRNSAGAIRSRRRRCCLTSWNSPKRPPGAVRVPHLVSLRRGEGVSDAVVWELTDEWSARVQVDYPHDWEFFESHLDKLLRLRAAVRAGRLPATPVALRLLELTQSRDVEISIELVYREADLFRLLLEAWDR